MDWLWLAVGATWGHILTRIVLEVLRRPRVPWSRAEVIRQERLRRERARNSLNN